MGEKRQPRARPAAGKRRYLRRFDLKQISEYHGLIGVDEAGRGALAGPVVAGAVLVNRAFLESEWCHRYASRIDDSKQLTHDEREKLYERMQWLRSEHRILYSGGSASVEEIETHNILGATQIAMRRALSAAIDLGRIDRHPPDPLFVPAGTPGPQPGQCLHDWKILVDGRPMKDLGFEHEAVVGGDARSLVIAMASIVAKVERDRTMALYDARWPGYGFSRHKGYGTEAHRRALTTLGRTPLHRSLFLRKLFEEKNPDCGQQALPFDE